MHALPVWFLLAHATGGFAAAAPALHERMASQVLAAYDSARGGFVTKAGAPADGAVELAWLQVRNREAGGWSDAALVTMRWTQGLHDTLIGGYFHGGRRHDTGMNAGEKRAESNARRLENLMDAWQTTGDARYQRDARRVVDWIERVLLDGRGGFVAAQVGDRELEPTANGLMIHAWLEWTALARDPRRHDFAYTSLDRVWDECWVEGLGLVRRNSMGDIAREPQLLDQVEMGRALVLAARLRGRPEDRQRAAILGRLVVERFQDRLGGFLTQSVPAKGGSIKKARVLAVENARAALFLCELTALTGEPQCREAAGRAAARLEKDLAKLGVEAADWALAARAAYAPERPEAPEWTAEATEDPTPPRPRSVRFKTGRR